MKRLLLNALSVYCTFMLSLCAIGADFNHQLEIDREIRRKSDIAYLETLLADYKKELSNIISEFEANKANGILKDLIVFKNKLDISQTTINYGLGRINRYGENPKLQGQISVATKEIESLKSEISKLLSGDLRIGNFLADLQAKIDKTKERIKECIKKLLEYKPDVDYAEDDKIIYINEIKDLLELIQRKNTESSDIHNTKRKLDKTGDLDFVEDNANKKRKLDHPMCVPCKPEWTFINITDEYIKNVYYCYSDSESDESTSEGDSYYSSSLESDSESSEEYRLPIDKIFHELTYNNKNASLPDEIGMLTSLNNLNLSRFPKVDPIV